MRHATITSSSAVAPILIGALLLSCPATAQLSWSPMGGTLPPARSATGAAISYHNYTTVLFGGLDAAGGVLGDTWRFDGASWAQMSGPSPSPRAHHSMATRGDYHVALFGGRDASGAVLADAWLWVANSQAWLSLPAGPPARERAAFATRPYRDAVLFGGRNGAQVLGDTWFCGEYTSPMWTSPTLASSPPARHGHAMACFDGSRIVLFGGVDAAGTLLDDTWILSGQQGVSWWTQALPPVRPSPRSGHVMRFDAYRGRAQLFGGEGMGGPLGDTWEWDGTEWRAITTSGTPAPRADAVLVDSRHAPGTSPLDGLLFGGRDAAGPMAQPWRVTSSNPATVAFFGPPSGLQFGLYSSFPWVGASFLVRAGSGSETLLLPHLIAGLSNTTSPLGSLPLSLGPVLDHAILLVDPVVLLSMDPALYGGYATALSLPAIPALVGTHLFLQAIAFRPTASTPGWVTSRGLDCTLGWL